MTESYRKGEKVYLIYKLNNLDHGDYKILDATYDLAIDRKRQVIKGGEATVHDDGNKIIVYFEPNAAGEYILDIWYTIRSSSANSSDNLTLDIDEYRTARFFLSVSD